MRANCLWVWLLLPGALTGCREGEKPASENVSVSLFKQGKGVLFSEETKKLFGIEVAEVVERPMQHRVERAAQVYRAGADGGQAARWYCWSRRRPQH